jgi:hypothetical protein
MGRKGAAGILVTHQCGVYAMRMVVLLARECLAGTLWLATGTHWGGGGHACLFAVGALDPHMM